jgi:hypothetical protein
MSIRHNEYCTIIHPIIESPTHSLALAGSGLRFAHFVNVDLEEIPIGKPTLSLAIIEIIQCCIAEV